MTEIDITSWVEAGEKRLIEVQDVIREVYTLAKETRAYVRQYPNEVYAMDALLSITIKLEKYVRKEDANKKL